MVILIKFNLWFLDLRVDILRQMRSISHIDSFEHGYTFSVSLLSRGPQISLSLRRRDKSYLGHSHPFA